MDAKVGESAGLLTGRFSGAARTKEQKNAIAAASIIEAREKEQALLSFYESQEWHLASICWKYLREFKVEGTKRKDGATESIIHELDPALYAKEHLERGYLPREVTYQKINGSRILLPPEKRPIENLFCTIAFHDRDEDDPDASRDTFIKFCNDHVASIPGLKEAEKNILSKRIDHMADVLDAITFGRKTRDSNGKIIKVPTHDNNLDVYFGKMANFWEAISCKGTDRLGGIITRFSRSPIAKMSPEKTADYLYETVSLFMLAQPMEDAMERYPQLSEYIETVNVNLRIALVVMIGMIKHHPELAEGTLKTRGVSDPLSQPITIHRYLPVAMRVVPWLTPDVCPMTCLLEGITAEADRHPQLKPIVDTVRLQMSPYLQQIGTALNVPQQRPDKYTP